MSRTTIDGLTVRTSSSADQVGSSRVVGGNLVDDFKTAKRTARTRAIQHQNIKDNGATDFWRKMQMQIIRRKLLG